MSAYLRKEPPKGNTKDVQNWFIMVQQILEIESIYPEHGCCNERGVNWAVSVSRKAGGISEVK